MRLQPKYTLIITGLLMVAMLVLSASLLYRFELTLRETTRASSGVLDEAMQEQLVNRGMALTALLAENLANPLYQFDMEAVGRQVRNVLERPQTAYVYVFDTDGLIVHDGSQHLSRFGTRMEDPFGERAAGISEPLVQTNDDIVEVAVPVALGRQHLGGVRVGFSRAATRAELGNLGNQLEALYNEHRRDQYLTVVGLTLALLLLGGIAAIAVARQLIRPIRQLRTVAAHVGTGNTAPVDIRRRDEIGELADTFQAMQRNLRQTTISKAYLDRIIDSMNDALLVTDGEGRIRRANSAVTRLTGYSPQELNGRDIRDVLAVDALPAEGAVDALAQETEARAHSGTLLPVAVSVSPIWEHDRLSGCVYVCQDVSERLRNEERLRLASKVFENTAECIVVTDAEGCIQRVNPAFAAVTGHGSVQSIGMNIRDLGASPSDQDQLDNIGPALASEGQWYGEVYFRRRNGEEFPAWLTFSTIAEPDGRVRQWTGLFNDLTEHREAEERIHQLAYYDHLTGLPNRLLFQDRLGQALTQASRHHDRLAVFFLDLDRFKLINDTKGHGTGDELLKGVAQRLRDQLREEDTLARLGGDEFAIVVPDAESEDRVAEVAHRLVSAFGQPFYAGAYELFTSTSIGISLFPTDASDADTLLKNADAAMYQAKRQGRNRFRFFTPGMNERIVEHMEIEEGLRRGLERDAFELYYQPQVSMADGRIVAAEALIRWEDPALGIVAPERFIPIAEDSGLIVSLGNWVLRRACENVLSWQRPEGAAIPVCVNLSARQFQDPKLITHVREILQETGVPSELLQIELTESMLLDDLDLSIAILMRLNEMGVRISIDDFGTGYSSLSYLKRLPIHTLKIDKSFVRDIAVDRDDATITSAIIALAHSLGIQVVAEGVENDEQLMFLRRNGCDFAQGFLFAHPDPVEAFQALVTTSRQEPLRLLE
ncbi:EAL domain-containing protein [Ectothiorhodospiraceae bacterium WFHF3C12]|nr:EAL domain-containing protein [Ectothiorhodospiraceae bacterium WFHF3C12]